MRVKKLEFFADEEISKKRFEFIFNGFIIGGNLNQSKGLTQLRRELSILDKLESISKECDCGKTVGTEKARDLAISGTVELTLDEYDTVYNYLGLVPWSTGKSVRDAVAVIDWIASL